HAKSESKRDAPKVYKPRALSLLDDGLFRPTVAKARLVYKTMGLTRCIFSRPEMTTIPELRYTP
ncbi:hypothetical protein, partial [Burkholderia ubonensis]|uniref:hypothetical protein n=1 Tax=Burkholderia ubonensis TaxID=101571 RepID=UPI001E5BCDFC